MATTELVYPRLTAKHRTDLKLFVVPRTAITPLERKTYTPVDNLRRTDSCSGNALDIRHAVKEVGHTAKGQSSSSLSPSKAWQMARHH